LAVEKIGSLFSIEEEVGMKKTLGIVALTLIMGVPAFAANNSSIIYTLQVGGSNAGGPNVPFDTTAVHEPADAVLDMGASDVLTWSVRVTVAGEIDGTVVGGAANLVWDLTLKGPDGQPVGPAFGLSNGSTAGFYSTIMNGGGGFPIQPASFTWEYGGGSPFGRLIDAFAANGCSMLQFTYPSTYQYYLSPGGVLSTTTVGATTGTLMGMGAGYPDLDPANGAERTGVGILAASDGVYSYTCYMDIGAKAPIAEGQINLAGMGPGTFTLVLTPGLGNNVISTSLCDFGTTGAFASAAGSTGTGSTITFIHGGVAPLADLTVTLDPPAAAAAGCTWTVDAGAPQASGATVTGLSVGSHTVAFQAVPGWAAPANATPTLVSGPNSLGPPTTTFTAVAAPTITLAESWRTHGAAGSFPVALSLVGPNATCEGRLDTRAGCNPVVVITFNKAIKDVVANPAMTVTATAVGGAAPAIGALTLDGTGTKLTIPVTASVNRTCVTLTMNNVASVDNSVPTAFTQKLVYVRTDIDNNRNCGSSDLLGIKQKQNAFTNVNATNFWYDIDCDSKCGSSDLLLCKQLQNAFTTTACAIP